MTSLWLPPPHEPLLTSGEASSDVWYRWFAELNNRYEEGTWTPTYTPAAGAFGAVTYDTATYGYYTRVGNVVSIQCRIRTDALTVGTASSDVYIDGLPFVAGFNDFQSLSVGYADQFLGEVPISAMVIGNTQQIKLYYRSIVDAAPTPLDVTDLDTGANDNQVYVGGFYFI